MLKRVEKAVELLKSGGSFQVKMEPHHLGGDRPVVRFVDADGEVVPGLGLRTMQSLIVTETVAKPVEVPPKLAPSRDIARPGVGQVVEVYSCGQWHVGIVESSRLRVCEVRFRYTNGNETVKSFRFAPVAKRIRLATNSARQ